MAGVGQERKENMSRGGEAGCTSVSGSNNELSVSGKQSYLAELFLGVQTPSPSLGLPLPGPPSSFVFSGAWQIGGDFKAMGRKELKHNEGNAAGRGEMDAQK